MDPKYTNKYPPPNEPKPPSNSMQISLPSKTHDLSIFLFSYNWSVQENPNKQVSLEPPNYFFALHHLV